MKRRNVLRAAGTTLTVGIAGCLSSGEGQSGSGVGIKTTTSMLAKYQSHERALEDGYQKIETCVDKLGIPFVNPAFTNSYEQPRVLFYEQTDERAYDLLGVEWFVPAESTDTPPTMFGEEDRQTFDGPMEGHYPGQPRHYGLHGWLFSENPNGLFAKFNPTITCSQASSNKAL